MNPKIKSEDLKMKKIICVILSLLIVISVASCSYKTETEISENGKVLFTTKTVISETELKKVKTLLCDLFGTYKTKSAVEKQLSQFNNAFTILATPDETIEYFKQNSTVKTEKGVKTYKYKKVLNFSSLKKYNKFAFPSSQKLTLQGKASAYDFWRFIDGGRSNGTAVAMAQAYGITLSQSEYVTFPKKVKKTNCKKIDDYTIKLNSKNIVYATTTKSTASWTKAKDIKKAVLNKVKKAIAPAKIKKLKVAFKNLNNIKISWQKQKNCDDYVIMRKIGKKGKWKLLDYTLGNTKYTDNSFTKGEKIYYKVRGVIFKTGFQAFGKYSAEKSIDVANLKIEPQISVLGRKKSAKVSLISKEKYNDGYEITYSRYRTFKNSTVISVKKLPKTIKKLRAGRRYSFKLRKFVKIKGKKYYSKYCEPVRVRIRY